MQVEFLGVGEACDETLPNTSLLVTTAGDYARRILLDCGFTAAPRLFTSLQDPEALDAVWVSHIHGDHLFGLPLLLLRLWETGRRRELILAGQEGIGDRARRVAELAYPGLMDKLGFILDVREIEPGQPAQMLDVTWTVAQTMHSRRNLALRLDSCGGSSLYYSGDGPSSAESEDLARGCGVMVHEAYTVEDRIPGHATVSECLDFARRTGARTLALVHLQREERKSRGEELKKDLREEEDIWVLLPEPGDVLAVGQGEE